MEEVWFTGPSQCCQVAVLENPQAVQELDDHMAKGYGEGEGGASLRAKHQKPKYYSFLIKTIH